MTGALQEFLRGVDRRDPPRPVPVSAAIRVSLAGEGPFSHTRDVLVDAITGGS